MFVRRMPDGTVQAATCYEPLFGELLTAPHPTRTFENRGQTVAAPRWSLCWSALELYEPKSAEQLAAAREKREAKAVEKEAADSPLFADLIRAEEYVPRRR